MKVYEDVELTFEADSHKYLVSFKVGKDWTTPKPTTGVTTYSNTLSKDFLAPWAAKLAAEYCLAQKGLQTNAVTLDEAKKQFKYASDAGARAGKLGHAYVEAKLRNKKISMPTDPEALKVVESVASALDKFMADWEPELVEVEKVLYSKIHNFAGTADFVAKIKDKLVLGDWKTTNTSRYNPDGLYANYFAQLGGYCIAYEEMTGEKVQELWAVNLPKDGGEYKLKRLEDLGQTIADCKMYFLTLKHAHEINQKFEWSLTK